MQRGLPRSEITNRLTEIRGRAGISASALAAQVGVTRQAIYAIEAGNYVPNTTVSLRLARALSVSVDELFRLKDESEPETTQKASVIPGPSKLNRGQALQLGRIDGRLVAVPPSPLEWYLPASDATARSNATAGQVNVRAYRRDSQLENTLIIAGCDPAAFILARHLQTAGVHVVIVHRNSSESLALLKQGRVHIAGTHLREESAVQRHFSRAAVAVVALAEWQEGLVTRAGNPKRIKTVEDLARQKIHFINRERGAGTRLLLDNELARLDMKPSHIRGYNREAPGHVAAASRVKTGAADCCMATEAAARLFGLGFVPLQTARYDLVLRQSHLQLAPVRKLFDAIVQHNFHRELSGSAGYDTAVAGTRVL
ncbi:MAG: helix-turn-helix domain-containing protein [Acidobacteriaceae bacterium]|nr:helix-turn-helix domain-containing protein [Acidobacteriaceae bacterium]